MNGSLDFFSEAARVGYRILDTASPNVKKNYLDQVSSIYRLMRDIHDIVIDVTIRASLARDLDQANRALSALNHEALEGTLRVRNWCDRLERLGREVHPLTVDANLSGRDRDVWEELCAALEQRESEVAWLYYRTLPEIAYLAHNVSSLSALKERLKVISEELVTQKANFDFLAKKAEAERDRLG